MPIFVSCVTKAHISPFQLREQPIHYLLFYSSLVTVFGNLAIYEVSRDSTLKCRLYSWVTMSPSAFSFHTLEIRVLSNLCCVRNMSRSLENIRDDDSFYPKFP
jgi:hypothetical protein